jgi:hypothetical protein
MPWSIIFSAANLLALLCWAALIFLPRHRALLTMIFYLGVGILCGAYAVLLILLLSGTVDGGSGGASFTSIEGVRAIFAGDGGVTVGWIHYLAFDLFAGLWIAREADARRVPRLVQAPILLLTFVAGPVGFIIWLALRRRIGRRRLVTKPAQL